MSERVRKSELLEVRVHPPRHAQAPYQLDPRKLPNMPSNNEFVYVNRGYVGSVNNVNVPQNRRIEAPTSVVREQYWACSRWPFGQRILAISVGILLGTVIGLAITVAIRGVDEDGIGGIFRSHPVSE